MGEDAVEFEVEVGVGAEGGYFGGVVFWDVAGRVWDGVGELCLTVVLCGEGEDQQPIFFHDSDDADFSYQHSPVRSR